jgi:predicted DNA-binding transcriptional regulator AlpA
MTEPNAPGPSTLLRRREVEARTGLRTSTLYERLATGTFPKPVRINARAVAWLASEVDAIVRAHVRGLDLDSIARLVADLAAQRETVAEPGDPNGRHVRVYVTLLNSPAWVALGLSSRALFVDLRSMLTGSNNGNLAAPLSVLKHRGWASSATLTSALYELRSLGFLAVTRQGGLRLGTRVASLYRFTDIEVFDQPKVGVLACNPTHDYRQFATVADAVAARDQGVRELREAGRAGQQSKARPSRYG